MLPAHMRGILLPSRAKVPICGGVGEARGGHCEHCTPPPDGLTTATPPPWNHPRKLCLRGARWAVGIVVCHFSGAQFYLFVIVGGGARVGVFINVRYFRHVYPGVQLGGGQRRMSQQFL